jgi:hypothetical protein
VPDTSKEEISELGLRFQQTLEALLPSTFDLAPIPDQNLEFPVIDGGKSPAAPLSSHASKGESTAGLPTGQAGASEDAPAEGPQLTVRVTDGNATVKLKTPRRPRKRSVEPDLLPEIKPVELPYDLRPGLVVANLLNPSMKVADALNGARASMNEGFTWNKTHAKNPGDYLQEILNNLKVQPSAGRITLIVYRERVLPFKEIVAEELRRHGRIPSHPANPGPLAQNAQTPSRKIGNPDQNRPASTAREETQSNRFEAPDSNVAPAPVPLKEAAWLKTQEGLGVRAHLMPFITLSSPQWKRLSVLDWTEFIKGNLNIGVVRDLYRLLAASPIQNSEEFLIRWLSLRYPNGMKADDKQREENQLPTLVRQMKASLKGRRQYSPEQVRTAIRWLKQASAEKIRHFLTEEGGLPQSAATHTDLAANLNTIMDMLLKVRRFMITTLDLGACFATGHLRHFSTTLYDYVDELRQNKVQAKKSKNPARGSA